MAAKPEQEQAMFALIETWKKGNVSQQDFCKAQGVSYAIFHYWYKKYRGQQAIPEQPSFVQIPAPATQGSPVVELILPDGRRVKFYQAVEASFLRILLS